MKDVPKRRKDGKCVVCKRKLPTYDTPVMKALRRLGQDPYGDDPFCSSDCAKRYYGTESTREVLT